PATVCSAHYRGRPVARGLRRGSPVRGAESSGAAPWNPSTRISAMATDGDARASEAEAPQGFRIDPHGRYSHTEAYVRRVLSASRLEPRRLTHVHLRLELRRPPGRGRAPDLSRPG